ncbi:hypothetical protein GSI_11908 [Ganoderma sinense ZZ0214-1]|uniref:Uncharacterized protein n=1 Tax=Ganoderma sinense ZZ0214-1 TaxID=1077348 RepID=A0A2G8RXA6_9APHY|nr:hypothetical protein GSI_11908 [Ganoderma sinense ZZ0214-1]
MEDADSHSTHNVGHLDTSRPQDPDGIEADHGAIINHIEQANGSGGIGVDTTTSEEIFQLCQLTELDLAVGLASMNLNDSAFDPAPSQHAALTTSLDPPCVAERNIGVDIALNACTALKNELDASLNAYRQSREVMLWHAANVCRVTMEYIHALGAAKGS